MRYIGAPNTAYGEDRRTYKEGTGGVSSGDTVFNVAYDGGRVEAYLNGVRLFPTDDYTKTASGIGSNVTLGVAIGSGNVLELVGYQGINAGNNVTEDRFIVGTSSTGSGGSYGGSTTVFNVSSSAGDLVSVWRNGVKLVHTTDFTVAPGSSTVTLGSAAAASDEITVQVVGVLNHANFGIADTNFVKIDSSSVADNEYARFTASGLESRSTSEVLSDIGGQASGSYITGSGSLSAQDLTDIGNLSGTNTGDQTNISGNAATVTTNANLTGHVTSSGNAASLGAFTVAQLSSALSDASISGNNTGDQTLPTDQSIVRAFCRFDGTTNSVISEFNCDSQSDLGTGNYTLGLDITMEDVSYAITTGLGAGRLCLASPNSTTEISVQTLDTSSANIDSSKISIAVWDGP